MPDFRPEDSGLAYDLPFDSIPHYNFQEGTNASLQPAFADAKTDYPDLVPPPHRRAPIPNDILTRPKLEPASAKHVWVIVSLVKIFHQIEMTREIHHFPGFLTACSEISAKLAPGRTWVERLVGMGRQTRKIAANAVGAIKNCSPLNRDYLETVTFGDSALREDLLTLFRDQLLAAIQKLPLIASAQDWRFLTHSLRGAAAAIGADEIAALCRNWEEAGMPGIETRQQSAAQLQAARIRFEKALLI